MPGHMSQMSRIRYRVGDVLTASRRGPTIIVFMINDVTPTWGGGVARQAARRHPLAQKKFRERCTQFETTLTLGSAVLLPIDSRTWLAPIVAQKGIGYSPVPRIRYGALEEALRVVARFARSKSALVRMPRIGCGSAGGRWSQVEETVICNLRGVRIEVFYLGRR